MSVNQVSFGGFKMVATTNAFCEEGWNLFCSSTMFLSLRMLFVMVVKVPPLSRSFTPATSKILMGVL